MHLIIQLTCMPFVNFYSFVGFRYCILPTSPKQQSLKMPLCKTDYPWDKIYCRGGTVHLLLKSSTQEMQISKDLMALHVAVT